MLVPIKKQLIFQGKKANSTTGFTLIELAVVMIIIGVLAATGLPNTMAMIGRGREAEAKNNLSVIGRSQQAYFLEGRQFADTLEKLDANVLTRYYDLVEPVVTDVSVKHRAESKAPLANNTREYEMGIYFYNQAHVTILCQSEAPGGIVQVPDTATSITCDAGKVVY